MRKYSSLTTPIGKILLIGSHDGLEELRLPNNTKSKAPDPSWEYAPLFFQHIEKQLADYFTGIRQHFNIQFNIKGTQFQFLVWKELQKIPFGETTHYGEIAKRIERPKASRAVGAANAKNPIPIIIPCHRVIGKDGSLTGFAGGLGVKRFLLHHENSFETV